MIAEVVELIKKNLTTKKSSLILEYAEIDGTEPELNLLTQCTHLKELVLSWNDIYALSFISSLKQLEILDLNNNQIESISSLKPLQNLRKLILNNNLLLHIGVEDIPNASKSLQYLDVSWNELQNSDFLKALKDLKELEYLDLSWNKFQELSLLAELKKLKILNLSNNKIQDFFFLKEMKQLRELYLRENKIRDISFLTNLSQLEKLDLSANNIQDFKPLKKLENLNSLKIDLSSFSYPPIWYAYLKYKKGKLGDNTHLSELPEVKKIWQLLSSEDKDNQKLAVELAKGQGWSEEEIQMYQNLL